MTETIKPKTKINYTVRIGQKVLPLAIYCEEKDIPYHLVFNRLYRMRLIIKGRYLELNPALDPAHRRILSKKHHKPGIYKL